MHCRLTSSLHEGHALHVDAFGGESIANVRSHRTSSDDVATNAFGTIECGSVLRQTNQAVFAGCVCSACGKASVFLFISL